MRGLILAMLLSSVMPSAVEASPALGGSLDCARDDTCFTLEQYVGALEHIDAQLAAQQLAAAQSEARILMNTEVVWAKGRFRADAALLTAIANASRAEGPHRARLLYAIDELRRAAGMETARADRKLLAQIAAEQEAPELPQGGTIPTTIDKDLPLLQRILESLSTALEWLREKIIRLLEWIFDLFPRRRPGESAATLGLRWIVTGVVILIVIIIVVLAFDVLRRSRPATPEATQTSAPLGSRRDEDPLSRGATEWERYAAQLADAGRYREAIRAWYHAVLVTCYAAGILHFRKGRTNWEYIASLPPSLAWRAGLITLTRRFEQEWYGADESTRDAHDDCRELAQRIIEAVHEEMRGAA